MAEMDFHPTLLTLCLKFLITQREGRSDILVERDDYGLGFIVELKAVKEEKQLEAACRTALLFSAKNVT